MARGPVEVLFLSFPALYVASRIANEWKQEDRVILEAGGTLSNPSPPVAGA